MEIHNFSCYIGEDAGLTTGGRPVNKHSVGEITVRIMTK